MSNGESNPSGGPIYNGGGWQIKGTTAPFATKAPQISATGDSYAVPLPKGVEPGAIAATDNILTTWRTFATALGQTAPGHVNRARQAINGLGRFGG